MLAGELSIANQTAYDFCHLVFILGIHGGLGELNKRINTAVECNAVNLHPASQILGGNFILWPSLRQAVHSPGAAVWAAQGCLLCNSVLRVCLKAWTPWAARGYLTSLEIFLWRVAFA